MHSAVLFKRQKRGKAKGGQGTYNLCIEHFVRMGLQGIIPMAAGQSHSSKLDYCNSREKQVLVLQLFVISAVSAAINNNMKKLEGYYADSLTYFYFYFLLNH